MTPEKVAILVVTGVIAVLLSITLMGSPDTKDEKLAQAPPPKPAAERPRPADLQGIDFDELNRGRYKTVPKPDPKPEPGGGSGAGENAAGGEKNAGRKYTVLPGDTLAGIAKKTYGRRSAADAIQAANGDLDPRRLKPGMEIVLPALKSSLPPKPDGAGSDKGATKDTAKDKVPAPAEGRIHVVAKGEKLQTIAKAHYGRAGDWSKIYDANRDRLARPEALQVGMRLRIP